MLWSSAETADTGMGLFDYLSNATVAAGGGEGAAAGRHDALRGAEGHLRVGQEGRHAADDRLGQRAEPGAPSAPADPHAVGTRVGRAGAREATTMAMLGVDTAAPSEVHAIGGAGSQGEQPADSPRRMRRRRFPGCRRGRAIDAIRGIFGRDRSTAGAREGARARPPSAAALVGTPARRTPRDGLPELTCSACCSV